MDTRTTLRALQPFLENLVRTRPFPWRIEVDWSPEVVDAKGALIAKYPDSASARALILLGRYMRRKMYALEVWGEKLDEAFAKNATGEVDRLIYGPQGFPFDYLKEQYGKPPA